jgi:Leucine-rich repeat (LRR) protein
MQAAPVEYARLKSKRRWFQFRLRTLLLLTTASAIATWQWTRYVEPYRTQRRAAAALEELGAIVTVEPADGPGWLRMLVGEDNFVSVSSVVEGEVSDRDLDRLKNVIHLRKLAPPDTQITDAGLEHLKNLTNLKRLFLDDTQITDAGLEHIKNLKKLEMLALTDTQITDAGLEHLKNLSNLKWLFLDDTQITNGGLEHLKGLGNLTGVDLKNTRVTNGGVADLQTALPKLQIRVTP